MAHHQPQGQRYILVLKHSLLCKPMAVFSSQLSESQEASAAASKLESCLHFPGLTEQLSVSAATFSSVFCKENITAVQPTKEK